MELRHLVFPLILLTITKHINGATILSRESSGADSSWTISLNISQLVAEEGYVAEEHYVTTADGYILLLVRVTNGTAPTGPPVLLMHGLLNSCDDWASRGNDSLIYDLVKCRYNVFLGNIRGNKYNQNHTSLSPKDKKFWNFSFHENGYYDVAAMIDYILKYSNRSRLIYIGHSQGTTAFFALASLRPEYNDKVSVMVSMATIAWLFHARSPAIRALAQFKDLEAFVLESLGMYGVLQYDDFWRFVTKKVCPSSNVTLSICASVLFSAYGYDYEQIDKTKFPKELGQVPGGASVKQLEHYAQLVTNNFFRQFDYNSKKANLAAYGTDTPPSYPMEKITTPVVIMHGNNDMLSSIEDVKTLASKIQNVTEFYTVPYDKFNHMDYLWARDANSLVYKKVIEVIKKYGAM